jgi:hypothetical protein
MVSIEELYRLPSGLRRQNPAAQHDMRPHEHANTASSKRNSLFSLRSGHTEVATPNHMTSPSKRHSTAFTGSGNGTLQHPPRPVTDARNIHDSSPTLRSKRLQKVERRVDMSPLRAGSGAESKDMPPALSLMSRLEGQGLVNRNKVAPTLPCKLLHSVKSCVES